MACRLRRTLSVPALLSGSRVLVQTGVSAAAVRQIKTAAGPAGVSAAVKTAPPTTTSAVPQPANPAPSPETSSPQGGRVKGVGARVAPYLKWKSDPDIDWPHVVAFEDRIRMAPHLYTAAQPGEHTEGHIGKYYHITRDERKGIPTPMNNQLHSELRLSGGYYLIREPEVKIATQLIKGFENPKNFEWLHKTLTVSGSRGCGKSSVLHYVTQVGIKKGWLMLSTAVDEMSKEKYGGIRESEKFPGVYDQPAYCKEYLKSLLAGQAETLKKIKLKNNYPQYNFTELDPEEEYEVPTAQPSLYDLCRYGVRWVNREMPSAVFADFMEEARNATETPVVIVIDNCNWMDFPSGFVNPAHPFKNLDPLALMTVNRFWSFLEKPPKTGLVLTSITSATGIRDAKKYVEMGIEVGHVQPYSDKELAGSLLHYFVSRVMSGIPEDNQTWFARIKGLTGNYPREVHKYAKIF